jgi:penicillin-binding protein 1A
MQSTTPTSPPPAPQKRKRPLWLKIILGFVGLIFAGILCVLLVLGYALVVATPNLPSLEASEGAAAHLHGRSRADR